MKQTKTNKEKKWSELSQEERLKRNSDTFERMEKEDLKIINANFSYKEFVGKDSNGSDTGCGKVICKTCEKSFSWNEWGRVRSRSLTFAGKHIAKEHNVGEFNFSSPIHLTTNFIDWIDKKSDEIEKKEIENAETFAIGDKVVSLSDDGRKGVVVDIVKKGHKEDIQLGKFDKEMIVVKEDKYNSKCMYQTIGLKKVSQ